MAFAVAETASVGVIGTVACVPCVSISKAFEASTSSDFQSDFGVDQADLYASLFHQVHRIRALHPDGCSLGPRMSQADAFYLDRRVIHGKS